MLELANALCSAQTCSFKTTVENERQLLADTRFYLMWLYS